VVSGAERACRSVVSDKSRCWMSDVSERPEWMVQSVRLDT
jgi:hypothetical protein